MQKQLENNSINMCYAKPHSDRSFDNARKMALNINKNPLITPNCHYFKTAQSFEIKINKMLQSKLLKQWFLESFSFIISN